MKILTVDIGTGTQDIFLYDSQLHIENGFKLVVPSPTMIVHQQVKAATRVGRPVHHPGAGRRRRRPRRYHDGPAVEGYASRWIRTNPGPGQAWPLPQA